MNRRQFNHSLFSAFALSAGTLWSELNVQAENGSAARRDGTEISQEEMNAVYEEVKTPFKYGIVVDQLGGYLVDSPGIFRKDGKWYMSFISQTQNFGYETFLAQSSDLLKWEFLGPLMTFRKEGWDAWQAAAYPALIDTQWGGNCEMQPFQNKYWYTYLGGHKKGYEPDPLSMGVAWTDDPARPGELVRYEQNPIMAPSDADARWFEKRTLYKSNVIWDRDRTLGKQFVMYYNGKQSSGVERIGMAVSDDMLHWERFGADPVIDNQRGISGDPQVVKIGDLWVMFYFGAFWKPKAFDTFAVSRDLVHWTKWTGPDLIAPTEPWDATYAHKPWMIKHDGIVYHFYCAVGDRGRTIALATSKKI